MQLTISVTELADLVCRRGDLDQLAPAGPTAREGQLAHQRLQASSTDEAEIALSTRIDVRGQTVRLGGRLDLLDRFRHRVTEIKSSYVPAERLPVARRELHWAQLQLYAWLYLRDLETRHVDSRQPPESIELTLCVIDLRSGAIDEESRQLPRSTLHAHAVDALVRYVDWRLAVQARRDALQRTGVDLPFPHVEYRSGQRDMAAAVYRTARDGGQLMIEAPTGIGKTVSALFPGIRALAERHVRQLVYLSAKRSGQDSALSTLRQMQTGGLEISVIVLSAKASVCPCLTGACERDASGRCPRTLGFFDRLPAAREALLLAGVVDRETLERTAETHQLCPFELALQMLPWVAVVICDYNYVFDPLVRLAYFNERRRDCLLLADEAHNLVDRGRQMHSAELTRGACLDALAARYSTDPVAARLLRRLCERLRRIGRAVEAGQTDVADEPPAEVLRTAGELLQAVLANAAGPVVFDGSAEEATWLRALCRLVVIGDIHGAAHRSLVDISVLGRRRDVRLRLMCVDAAEALNRQYRRFGSTVVFSASLAPVGFFRQALGLPDETRQLVLGSPFSPAQTLQCRTDWIDTRYRHREASIPRLLELIDTVTRGRAGNYVVYLPSYTYLQQLADAWRAFRPDVACWVQTPGLAAAEQDAILESLSEPGLRVGFAILGGVFGEGIDLQGDRLVGVIVVGVGLPGHDTLRSLIADHHSRQGHDGYSHAYRFPGFVRVLQTVGRLIRHENDRGVVIFADWRFGTAAYRSLFPTHWQVQAPRDCPDLDHQIRHFWALLPKFDHKCRS